MSIKMPAPATTKKLSDKALDAFAGAAPVAEKADKAAKAESDEMVQISLKLLKSDLAAIDEAAAQRRIARAALIRQAVFAYIKET